RFRPAARPLPTSRVRSEARSESIRRARPPRGPPPRPWRSRLSPLQREAPPGQVTGAFRRKLALDENERVDRKGDAAEPLGRAVEQPFGNARSAGRVEARQGQMRMELPVLALEAERLHRILDARRQRPCRRPVPLDGRPEN